MLWAAPSHSCESCSSASLTNHPASTTFRAENDPPEP